MTRPNPLLTVAAILFFGASALLLFVPEELTRFAGRSTSDAAQTLLQLVGSGLFGFALLNWTARYTRTDGIFGRPLVMANLGHAVTAALLLGHFAFRNSASPVVLAAFAAYGLLALAFGLQLFSARRPVGSGNQE
jgi:hypothetical protein